MTQCAASSLEQRIERLESIDEIRQLAAKYALALDMRDPDAWVNLFPADIRVSETEAGREALRRWFDETMRSQFSGTSHHIGGHIIEFLDADHAQGVLYSKNEHEAGTEWVIMQMMYFDRYERSGAAGISGAGCRSTGMRPTSTSPPSASARCAGRVASPTRAAFTICFPHGRNSGRGGWIAPRR
jgi:hypothetical protein